MTVFLAQMQRKAKIMNLFMSTNRMKSTGVKQRIAQTFLSLWLFAVEFVRLIYSLSVYFFVSK